MHIKKDMEATEAAVAFLRHIDEKSGEITWYAKVTVPDTGDASYIMTIHGDDEESLRKTVHTFFVEEHERRLMIRAWCQRETEREEDEDDVDLFE
jgi:hypothetical protein